MLEGDIDLTEHRDFKLDKDSIENKYLPEVSNVPWKGISTDSKEFHNSTDNTDSIVYYLDRLFDDERYYSYSDSDFNDILRNIRRVIQYYRQSTWSTYRNDGTREVTISTNNAIYTIGADVFDYVNYPTSSTSSYKVDRISAINSNNKKKNIFGDRRPELKQNTLAKRDYNYFHICEKDRRWHFSIGKCPYCERNDYDDDREAYREIIRRRGSVDEIYMSEYNVDAAMYDIFGGDEYNAKEEYYNHRWSLLDQKRKRNAIPWLDKLSGDNFDDYMAELHEEEEKDYSSYLTSTWFVDNRV
jgi:hypothetical protein